MADPFYTSISAESQTKAASLMQDLLPLVIDLRIFSETLDRTWESATPERVYESATPVRAYESQTPVLEIENRTGTEIYSIPYESKPYPFSS